MWPLTPRRLEGSALYLVMVVALFVALLCASLVGVAYFFRQQSAVKFRFDRLQDNLVSAQQLILAGRRTAGRPVRLDLFGQSRDSAEITTKDWGIYEVAVCKAFEQQDTLSNVFTVGRLIDSATWSALYLTDEDRPVSVSGKTNISGNAYIPKAGIKKAYVDGQGYDGRERVVSGHIYSSNKILPELNPRVVDIVKGLLSGENKLFTNITGDLLRSFKDSTVWVNPGRKNSKLTGLHYTGNVVLWADTTIVLDSTVQLEGVIVVAPTVIIENGFHGNCQVFAKDSVSIGEKCLLTYPSAVGIMKMNKLGEGQNNCFTMGKGSELQGILFLAEGNRGLVRPNMRLADGAMVKGEIYQPGTLTLTNHASIWGSTRVGRLLYVSSSFIYENYLINAQIDANALSKHYLTSQIFDSKIGSSEILQWLER